jgi:DNA helicase-2/ATP-dependent DNA helicase PcrA
MPWDVGLQGVARAIAATDESPLRVIAGPGTGKSFALKRRVARLLEGGANPRRLLAVTFTRNAARELVRDIRALEVGGCELVRAGTLHSYCFALLLRNEVLERLRRFPRPLISVPNHGYLQFETSPMFYDLQGAAFGNLRAKTERVRAFEAAWARLQSENPGWPHDPVDQAFHRALEDWLIFHQAILIGELIPLAFRYLRDNPACAARHEWDHVVVDEYQDLNRAEQSLIDLLAEHGALALVGDEDQSIYGRLRHAHPEGIRDFHVGHLGTHDEHLIECRRCPALVVEMANHFIARNHPPGAARRLVVHPGNPPGEVHVVQWDTSEEEARGVAAFIRYLMNTRMFPAGEILILCPLRDLGYRIRAVLRDAVIPAHSFYSEEPLKETGAQEAFAYLRLLANPADRVALRFLLGYGSNSWLWRQYAQLRALCEQTGESPWNALTLVEEGALELGRAHNLRARFTLIRDRVRALAALRGQDLIDALFPDGQDWSESFRDAASLVLENDAEATTQDLSDELVERVSHHDMPEAGNFVRIMSLHKSKGLTSRAVIMTGLIQNLVPRVDWRVMARFTPIEREEHLREQRRLFYVGITRTREVLVLSSPATITANVARGAGLDLVGGASEFLDLLGPLRPPSIRGRDWQARGFR